MSKRDLAIHHYSIPPVVSTIWPLIGLMKTILRRAFHQMKALSACGIVALDLD